MPVLRRYGGEITNRKQDIPAKSRQRARGILAFRTEMQEGVRKLRGITSPSFAFKVGCSD